MPLGAPIAFASLTSNVPIRLVSMLRILSTLLVISLLAIDASARPEIIDKSRMSRIARGSGRRSKDVRALLGRFTQMREMMSQIGKGGMLGKIPGLGKMAGAGGIDPTALLAGPAGKSSKAKREAVGSRGRQKGKRKQARKARRKNRRR